MPGLEAMILRRRAFGGGQTAHPGNSHSGPEPSRTMQMQEKTACIMMMACITSGTIITAVGKEVSCAARRFAQVKIIERNHVHFNLFIYHV